jgi:hypothetical protein
MLCIYENFKKTHNKKKPPKSPRTFSFAFFTTSSEQIPKADFMII